MNNSTNINIGKSRNTEAQQNWYERRDQFLSNVGINDIANNFSLFETRQKITRFIETFRNRGTIRDIPGNILKLVAFDCKLLI